MNHQIPLPKRNNIPVHKQAAICMDIVDLVTVLLTKFEINNS
jgi:hypothetical protein